MGGMSDMSVVSNKNTRGAAARSTQNRADQTLNWTG